MTKNDIPFTKVNLNIIFVENYEHEYSNFFKQVTEFTQYENCKLYETIFKTDFIKTYYKFVHNVQVFLQ